MKKYLVKFAASFVIVTCASSAWAGSILVMSPTSSKIEVIGTPKKLATQHLATIGEPEKHAPEKEMAVVEKPATEKKSETIAKKPAPSDGLQPAKTQTAMRKPELQLSLPMLRTGDVELPVVRSSTSGELMKVRK